MATMHLPKSAGLYFRSFPFPSIVERAQSGPQRSRARRFSGAAQRTLEGEDRSETITKGRKGDSFQFFAHYKV